MNEEDNSIHTLTKEGTQLLQVHTQLERDGVNKNEPTSGSETEAREKIDRKDSGISRSSSSQPSPHPSSKWAYRTINLHPGSETEASEKPTPRQRPSFPLKITPGKKKTRELPIVRGIPRVIRRVNTETMLMAGRCCSVFL